MTLCIYSLSRFPLQFSKAEYSFWYRSLGRMDGWRMFYANYCTYSFLNRQQSNLIFSKKVKIYLSENNDNLYSCKHFFTSRNYCGEIYSSFTVQFNVYKPTLTRLNTTTGDPNLCNTLLKCWDAADANGSDRSTT